MKCPHCYVEIHEDWKGIYAARSHYSEDIRDRFMEHMDDEGAEISLLWMSCPHDDCGRLIVKGISRRRTYAMHIPQFADIDEWIILPRRASRPIDPLVPEEYAYKLQAR